jgi:tRNA-splicing ligase RtcB
MIVFGQHEQTTLDQIKEVSNDAIRVALMADGHLGYGMPIGGVAAYDDQVSVTGVGFDIACGNMAIRTDRNIHAMSSDQLKEIAGTIQSTISFGVGRSNLSKDAPTEHDLFTNHAWDIIPHQYRDRLKAKARNQLGTVGSGNHYVDVFADESGTLWVGVHFGSRGLGHEIATSFISLARGGAWGERGPETTALLDLSTQLGQDYWSMMELAGEYAYAGREWVARQVVDIVGGIAIEEIHNHHNFAWREEHDGRELIVVRKGATPAFPGQRGFVGGSMGDVSVILEGVDSENSRQALYSTVHGAGRVMSRTEARGKVHRKTGEVIREGKVTPQMMNDWITEVGVILRGGGLDESPHAYRRLPEVLSAQGDTIKVVQVLYPAIVVMAGANEHDPYKD